ncbi:hypothetical protein AQUCO_01100272v1 [Aquilegia coerulea]|uniref:Remorin C-terminal domain-containing protein n=1 Tax=Aquilegia coerulea TaxID=218851 RepID=A0A2G5E6C5_AQUCA|nr:hypothetical protein AQUCO_01100272v1 [Aquilegia coerulea]PIA51320.1 hypothetical protein AQUCO_01100272v1 [Aquilegia coerulea]PIA51321.1 hypothetical protein AQUCO_01100272v1 [Aquilegia coerulea]
MRSVEDKGCFNHGSAQEIPNNNAVSFEFHKGNEKNRGSHHRMALGKPTPSKWDDAQKWLSGLSRGGDRSQAITKPRNSNADDRRLIAPVPQKEESPSSSDEEDEVGNQNHATSFHDEGETKKIDSNESFWRINKTSEESSSAIKSICVRDMGTEMTPIASQEPSRTCTPLRATTPAGRSPISSRSSTPGRCPQGVQSLESYQTGFTSFSTRCDPVPFSRTSGEPRWPNREEEESNISKVYENKNIEQATKPNPLEIRAIAWDEAERAKYMARYKREEVKIQAWENHEKRKAEMDMKRIEVKAERLKSRAQEKLSNKVAATRRIAEEKRANAEAKLNEQAARTSERADYMRRTGHLPSSFSFKMPSLCW